MVGSQPSKNESETRNWPSGAGCDILKYVRGLTVDLMFADVLIHWPTVPDIEKLNAWRHQRHLGDLWSEH